jgi:hypothetical protein
MSGPHLRLVKDGEAEALAKEYFDRLTDLTNEMLRRGMADDAAFSCLIAHIIAGLASTAVSDSQAQRRGFQLSEHLTQQILIRFRAGYRPVSDFIA